MFARNTLFLYSVSFVKRALNEAHASCQHATCHANTTSVYNEGESYQEFNNHILIAFLLGKIRNVQKKKNSKGQWDLKGKEE